MRVQSIKKNLFVFILSLSFMGVSAQQDTHRLSTHILDISKGEPAQGVSITLYKLTSAGEWLQVASGITNESGRIADFLPDTGDDNTGTYMLKFYTEPYFGKQNLKSIYPFVEVIFRIEGKGHYHIPITMSANGYATYRGN